MEDKIKFTKLDKNSFDGSAFSKYSADEAALFTQHTKLVKIGDLPEHTNLQSVKVKLPLHVYKASSLPMYGIKNKPVYLQGWVMGDFFVKTDLKSSQIYPMFWSSMPPDIKDWEVVI